MATTEELACVYSALILQDDNSPVTEDKLQTLLKASRIDVEPFWPGLFVKAVESFNFNELVSNVGTSAGAPAATANGAGEAAGGAPAPESKKEEKKEEEEEEEDDDMGFGLFD